MNDETKFGTTESVAVAERNSDGSISKRAETNTLAAESHEVQRPLALFSNEESTQFRSRWNDIQTKFIDEPRHSVEEADALVADVINRLAQVFTDERAKLNGHWEREQTVPTEDLRMTVLRYRSLFDRLLSL